MADMEIKRIALFAHYDRDGLIDDYVIYYLQGLQKVAQSILFVSNCELAAGEAAKLEGLAELVFAGKHDTYDFGSWKIGFEHIGYNLTGWDEVIIANDSCYGPITPLEDLFARLEKTEWDFWSPNAALGGKRSDHFNAYFLVFRCVPGMQATLREFFSSIDAEPDYKQRFRRFEVGLTRALWKDGHKGSAFVTDEFETLDNKKYILSMPFVKVRVLRDNPSRMVGLAGVMKSIEATYPRRLIDAHMERMIGTSDPSHHHYRFIGKWNFNRFGISISSNIKTK